tara:strand:+ start:573 stop:1004 length:432 start_codon:yes stop_codon:yes gene_type:complete
MDKKFKIKVSDVWYSVEIIDLDDNKALVSVDGEEIAVEIIQDVVENTEQDSVVVSKEDSKDENQAKPIKKISAPKVFKSPMPGVIISVAHKEGDSVITGDEVCVLEAMKMQQTLKADWSGVVKKVYVKAGDQVLDGDPILELE